MALRRALVTTLAGVSFLAAAGGPQARACDIKIHEAAYKEWPRDYYLFYMIHDNKNKLAAGQNQLAKELQEKHLKHVNADVVKLNVDASMLREDRELLSSLGCGGWPQMVVFDKEGEVVSRASGKLGKRELRYFSERTGFVYEGYHAVIIYRKSDPRSKARAESVTPEKLAEVDLKGLKVKLVDGDDPANRKLAERFRPPKLPIILLVSPRGKLLESYPGDVQQEELLKSLDSPGRQKLTKALDKTAMTFVLVRGKDNQANSKMLEQIKKPVAKAQKLFEIKVQVVEVDGTSKEEKTFVKNLDAKQLPAAVPVFGKGKHIEPMTGKITEDDVLARTQFMIQNCTCVLNPRALGEDLLLKWKGVDGRVADE
jgi:thioredoxin-related protein